MDRIVRKLDKKILAFAKRKRVAAYSRVSTDNEEQLSSSQRKMIIILDT